MAANLNQDHLLILSPGSTAHTVEIKTAVITIGSGADNYAVLDDPNVSPQHARVEIDGSNYKVIDLDSESGTYLDDVKLVPSVPQVWKFGQVLRIGQNWLRLERGVSGPPQQFISSDETLPGRGLARSRSSDGGVVIFLETLHLSVAPGGSVTTSIILVNQGTVVEQGRLMVEGIPAEWVSGLTPLIRLLPGTQQAVRVVIRPPRSPQSRAGSHPLTFRLVGQTASDQVTEAQGTLNITTYAQFHTDLQPHRILAGQTARVLIENQGNAPHIFKLKWRDWADELTFNPPQVDLPVDAGTTIEAKFRVTPRRRPWFGSQQAYPFSTQVSSPGGEIQKLEGEVISSGRISPLMILTLLIFLCLGSVIVGAGAVTGPQILGSLLANIEPRETATYPIPTPVSTMIPTAKPSFLTEATATNLPTATPTATPSPEPSHTVTRTPLPQATATKLSQPTATPTKRPSTATPTVTPAKTPLPTSTPVVRTQPSAIPPSASKAYDVTDPLVNAVLNQIPLVVWHETSHTCASHAGLNNLLEGVDGVQEGHVIGPHAGDFVWKSRECGFIGNVLFKYTNGSFQLIRQESAERFCQGEAFLSFEKAMQMFASGEIEWSGHIGDSGRGVTGCDLSAK